MQTYKHFFLFNSDFTEIKIRPNSLEHAYLLILQNDVKSAKKLFQKIDSPRANWGNIFCDILQGFIKEFPTYFQLRNFLEIDLDFLIKNQKIEYIEQVLGALETLSIANHEIYKYVARVMQANNFPQLTHKYLQESKHIHYNDPELLYMLAKYYLDTKDVTNANFYIEECIKILPNYYPAQLIKREIEEIQN